MVCLYCFKFKESTHFESFLLHFFWYLDHTDLFYFDWETKFTEPCAVYCYNLVKQWGNQWVCSCSILWLTWDTPARAWWAFFWSPQLPVANEYFNPSVIILQTNICV